MQGSAEADQSALKMIKALEMTDVVLKALFTTLHGQTGVWPFCL